MKTPVFSSIGSKIMGGFLILLALLLLISWIANNQFQSIERLVSSQVMEKAFARHISQDIILKSVTVSGYVKDYLSSADDVQRRELRILINDELRTIREEMMQISGLELNSDEKKIFSGIQDAFVSYHEKISELLAKNSDGLAAGRNKGPLSGEFSDLHSHFLTLLLDFDNSANLQMYQAWDNARYRIDVIKKSILLLSVTAAVIALLLGYMGTRSITLPVSRLVAVLERYANGEHDIRSDISGKDEIGFFSERFNTMLEQLQASQQRLLDIIDFLPDATFVIDKEQKVIAWNKAIEELTGISKKDIIGRGDYAYAVPFYGEPKPILIDMVFLSNREIEKQYVNIERKGNYLSAETHLLFSRGKAMYVLGTASPLFDRDGNLAGAIESIRDITEQKLSEKDLRDSEERFRTLAASAQDAIIILDNDGNISYWNEAGERLFGYSSDEALGRNGHRLLIPQRYYEKYNAGFGLFRETGEGPVIGKTQELTGVKKDGTEFPVEVSISAFKWNDKWNAIGILRDLTERRKLELQFMQSQKMEAVGTLAGGIAHDFNNMLTGIMGSLSLLKHKLEKQDAISREMLERFLNIMDDAGTRATDTVQQLLTLSRKQEMTFTLVDLTRVIKRVMTICSTAMDKSIELVPAYPDRSAMVMGDENHLEQILLNLCINAGHSMTLMRDPCQPQGGRLTVEIEPVPGDSRFRASHPLAKEGEYWKVSVKDTGVGMDSRTVVSIFDPFFTTKEKGQGTGLGLAMVYNSVKQHDGFIDVYSEVGTGTTFNVYLPVYHGDDVERIAPGSGKIEYGSGLILLVDDEECVRLMARSILEECGYDVITAVDGEEAVNIFRERHGEIDLVILDMVMPRKSGKDAFIEMQKIDPSLKVLLASGFRLDERVKEVMELGIKAFVQKPYSITKLSGTVYSIISRD